MKKIGQKNITLDNELIMTTVFLQLEKLLLPLSNKELAAVQRKYLKNNFDFIGIQKPVLLKVQQDLLKQFPIKHEEELIEVVTQLWQKHEREYHYLACNIAQKFHRLWTPNMFPLFETMIRTKSWWDTVDTIAANLIGPLVARYPLLKSTLDFWIRDEYMWARRTALIYQLRYKKNTDYKRLFMYCSATMHEKEFFIRKAIGWALREYSKTNPAHVATFIETNKNNLSYLSIKEGSKYI